MAWTSSWEGFALEASDWRKVIMMISHLKLHWLLYWCVTHAFAALYVVSVVFPESYFFFFGRVVQYGSVFISLICWGGSPLYISQIKPLTSIKIDTWRIHSHEGVSNHYTVFAFFFKLFVPISQMNLQWFWWNMQHKEKRFEWSVHRYNAKMLNTEVQE